MPTPHLLLHLPERRKCFESSPELIEEYCSLAEERGYVWLCKPGPPLDPSLRQELGSALQQAEKIYVYLFVRLSMDERRLALYRAKLLGVQGPGPNRDTGHILPRFRGCGTWLKLTGLELITPEQMNRLYDAQTGRPVPIWTDLRTDLHLFVEGEPWTMSSREPHYNYWLLCLSQARAKAEFDQAWRFRPIATYQPGSTEFIAEYEADASQQVLVYDRVFGSPTYLTILGIFEVTDLTPQGTSAGALIYAAQLREVMSFSYSPRLDPRHGKELWNQLEIAQHPEDWDAMVSGDRVLLSLPDEDYARILLQVNAEMEGVAIDRVIPGRVEDMDEMHRTHVEDRAELSDLNASLTAFETIAAKPAHAVTEVECYHLLRILERVLREFIDLELSTASRDWWAEGRLPRESRIQAEERKQKREHPFPWLSQQDLPAREYLDFSDYAEIITMERNWNEVFQPIFIRPEVIRGKLIELNLLRNDIAHMRGLPSLDKETFIAVGRQLLLTAHSCLSK